MIKSLKIAIINCFFALPIFAQTTIHTANFDTFGDLDGWTQGNEDNFNWTQRSGFTPSNYTGPSSASSGNYYMYTESTSNFGNTANFISPSFNLSGISEPEFTFYYHMYGVDMGSLSLNVSTDGGATFTTLWSRSGQDQTNSGAAWIQVVVDLSAYSGQTIYLMFKGLTGSGYRSDMAIDKIALTGTIASSPEINIVGSGTNILSGNTVISTSDNTDFGTVNIASNSTAHIFTIENLGTSELTLSDVSILGVNTADFSVDISSTVTSISSSSSTTFQVTFSPSTLGVKTASIQILNNDSNEGTYTFNIEGSGVQNFFDSDGDGIYDNVDIDDDNDGVLDASEEEACKKSSISIPAKYKFLNETFGAGGRTTINTTYDAITTYCYEDGSVSSNSTDCPSLSDYSLNDGEYTVGTSAQIASWSNDYWYIGGDHTGDTNGRMALFNASYDPGLFYTATINGALPNVPITYSFWVLNLDRTDAPGIATRLRPNIRVEFRDASNILLASITTGDIPPTDTANSSGDWVNFSADLTFSVDEFFVYFYNNETGGAGNDLALDDIVISQTLCDTDSDGVADVFDLDSDNDGIPDVVESGLGIISLGEAKIPFPSGWVDANGNGMHDAAESNVILDSDSDGTPNYLDLDSDNDGIFDVDESGAGNTANTSFQNGDGDISGNGVGQGLDSDAIRETDYESDGTLEYFTDGILDIYDFFNGVTFDTAYGNENQGTGNTYYVLDTDGDGIPDYMDITSDGTNFDIASTLYANFDADNNGIIDGTSDVEGDGILDTFDTDDSGFGSPRDLDRSLNLYFDGRNDYAEDIAVINAWAEVSMMCWVKIDPASSGIKHLIGQNEYYIQLNADKTILAHANGSNLNYSTPLTLNQWVHIATTYSSSNGVFKLFINGDEIAVDTGVSGALSADSSLFTLGKLPGGNSNFYHGYLDEVRVFNKALSNNELQKIVYQEIENNSGIVRGGVIPMDVTNYVNEATVTPLDWSYLQRYFKMDVYKDDVIDDLSTPTIDSGSGAKIYNMKIIDVQTAPLPFITQKDNTTIDDAVDITANGINGNDVITYDWSIVKILHNNITYDDRQKHLGLFVNELDASSSPIKFSIQNSSELNISWYLKLDGFIDLEDESQLVQSAESVLDEDSLGYIEQDQQGTQSSYNYNYWTSSVSPIAAGVGTNNANNSISEVLFDGTTASNPLVINFQPAYPAADGNLTSPITLSSYWLYTFNGLDHDYNSWVSINENSLLKAGEGYTMKGTSGVAAITDDQNYVFKGKPHNGNITLSIAAGDNRLVGNPYPSALDADKFILDNISDSGGLATTNIFNGALYFWDHFSGHTHVLKEYVGGYATYTLMGGAKAYANDELMNNNGSSGIKIPKRFIPVNQGFFVNAVLDTVSNSINTLVTGGDIRFKNSQRVCVTENSGNALFLKSGGSKEETKQTLVEEDKRSKIRLLFKSPSGYERQLLVGADGNASADFDLGYDGVLIEDNVADMFWTFSDAKFVIQAVNNFYNEQELALGLNTNIDGLVSIEIESLENMPEGIEIYIKDNLVGEMYQINENPFEINLLKGEYFDRFSVTFKYEQVIVEESIVEEYIEEIEETVIKGVQLFMNNSTCEIQINRNEEVEISGIQAYNYLGQLISNWGKGFEAVEFSLPFKKVRGVYFIQTKTNLGLFNKKIFVK